MFFLPWDAVPRRRCVKRVEELAALAEADVLGWADVPIDLEALPPGAAARRTAPVVRQALFRRPKGLSEDGWLACRYLLRLALDEVLGEEVGTDFSVASLSNRTVVYKGLAELSQIGRLYPDLRHEDFASRFVLFHSRYSTNTTTAWRRAQPFWALGHNGEISTIKGNVAWMEAIGPDLVQLLVERHPRLKKIGERVRSIICGGGSDTANLDDMVIALLTGGLSLPQAHPGPAARGPVDGGGERPALRLPRGDERLPRRLRRPRRDRRLRRRRGGRPPRPQRPAAPVARSPRRATRSPRASSPAPWTSAPSRSRSSSAPGTPSW